MGHPEKIVLYVINGLFVISSLFITFVGVWLLCDEKSMETLHLESLNDYRTIYGIAAIVIGIISIVVHSLGILAAYKENQKLLKVYAAFFIAGSILVFLHTLSGLISLNDTSVTKLEPLFKSEMRNELTLSAINSLQSKFECCGYNGPADVHQDGEYPWSCCGIENQTCITPVHKQGCMKMIKKAETAIVMRTIMWKAISIFFHIVCVIAALRLVSKLQKSTATSIYAKM